jgi:glycosyl transferase, family 25
MMLFESLRQYHDAVYVLTIPSARDRHENVVRELGEDNFEFVFGVDKNDASIGQFIEDGVYDNRMARETDRSSKPMTLGHICCSLGHRMIYEKFLESDAERCLIFEDDVVVNDVDERTVSKIVEHAPVDAELIYWGWEGGGYRPLHGHLKQVLYHVQHSLGLLKYNHTMIRNLFARPYDEYFDIAGKHFLAHAYTVNRRGAEVLLKWATPIIMNADNALRYAIMNGELSAYISKTRLFDQRSSNAADPMQTMTAT